jgi:hypothetical protein
MKANMTTTDELRSKLGRVGIWMGPPQALGLEPEVVARAIAGADHVVVQPLGASGAFDITQLGAVADAVAGL